jgi:hypothetical protein
MTSASVLSLPLRIQDVDAQWASAALSVRYPGVKVTHLEIGNIIWGSATKVWLSLRYDDAGERAGLPHSMVLKSGFDPKMRALAAGVYERESLFFGVMAPTLSIPLPRCYFAGTDPIAGQSALLLEDLIESGCRFGRIEEPLSIERGSETLALLASLHARWWNQPDAAEMRGFTSSDVRFSIGDFLLSRDNWDRCFDAPRVRDVPAAVRNRDAVAHAVVALRTHDREGPRCLIHGDAHLGNLYFDHDGAPRLLDWQAATSGSWIQDVAYVVTCALSTSDRRIHEQSLLRGYLERLRAQGIPDAPGFDAAWLSYRRQVAYGILGLLCTPEMQSEEYARIMGTRFAMAIEDLETLTLFG